MKESKISVIVAAYNTEKYIQKCMDSLINQTYKNIEIIVVDDASTDGTLKILESYKKKIKIIKNEENKGQAYARNRALEIATGEYIGFVDSDDYIDLNYYEEMMKQIKEEDSDLAICDIKMVYENENKTTISPGCEGKLSKINLINNGLAASPCNKLFKKELLKYSFEEGKINEDIAVVIPAMMESKKVSYAKNVYYYYIQRKGSTQNSRFSKKRFDIFYGVAQTLDRIKGCKDYEEIKDALIFNQLISLLLFVFPKIKDKKERKNVLKEYARYSKPYDYKENKYFKKFLEKARSHQKLYFRLILFFLKHQLVLIPNKMISTFQWYQSKIKKSVIPEITMEKIVEKAKKNQTYSNYGIAISAAIPNYNYETFLMERVYSVVSQKVKLEEILILDDCSKDNSIEMIEKIKKELTPYIKIRTIYNKENSGTAFKQWKKAIDNAKGDYIWIAEADDFCKEGLLKELVKPIQKNKNIYLSYCDTAFINQEGKIILPSIIPEIDIQKSGHWNQDFENNGLEEIKKYAYLNCTIANVSSVLIKKEDYEEILKIAGTYKQAGDWFFYLSLMKKGDIAFSSKTYNYYRMHGNNVTSMTKKEQHFNEIKRIHEYLDQELHFNEEQKEKIKERYEFLKKVWELKTGGEENE